LYRDQGREGNQSDVVYVYQLERFNTWVRLKVTSTSHNHAPQSTVCHLPFCSNTTPPREKCGALGSRKTVTDNNPGTGTVPKAARSPHTGDPQEESFSVGNGVWLPRAQWVQDYQMLQTRKKVQITHRSTTCQPCSHNVGFGKKIQIPLIGLCTILSLGEQLHVGYA